MIVFFLPNAGGSEGVFSSIERELPQGVQFIAMEYAGHGKRISEPFSPTIDSLADDMYALICDKLKYDEAYALFGYSMGCIVLIEVLRRILERKEIRLPIRLFVAAHAINLSPYPNIEIDINSIEAIKEYTTRFGGVPDDLSDNSFFWRLYLPIFSSDYALIQSYNYRDRLFQTDLPTDMLYSQQDTPFSAVRNWILFAPKITFHEYPGGHFFAIENDKKIAALICSRLVSA